MYTEEDEEPPLTLKYKGVQETKRRAGAHRVHRAPPQDWESHGGDHGPSTAAR